MPARRKAGLAGLLDLDPGHPGPGLTLRSAVPGHSAAG
jgi:hypothetical protein